MALDDFYKDLFSDGYWENSHSGSINWTYIESADAEGNITTHYVSGSFSITNYIPKTRINIGRIIDVIRMEEQSAAEDENYEKAADLRDKIDRIKEHKELLVKLYDLKEKAVYNKDYTFAINIKDRIDNIIKGKE